MDKKKECKIVQDLLPNYIDKLTNEETNTFIEEHLKECDNCNKILADMQKNIELNTSKNNKKEVKYMKKYKTRMLVLKSIILLIVLIFVVIIGRKVIIISDLQSKTNEYVNSKNYHRIIYTYDKDKTAKLEVFVLGDKKRVIRTMMIGNEKNVTEMFFDGTKTNIYIEKGDKKIAQLNQELIIAESLYNALYTENLAYTVFASIPATVNNKEFNGEECYYITNFNSLYNESKDGIYIDKETGLVLRSVTRTETMTDGDKFILPTIDYVYEFNTVTEEDFIEPDISEYDVQE